jgi:hypothetical protein
MRCSTCGEFKLEAGSHGLSNLPTCPECGAHQTTHADGAWGALPAPEPAGPDTLVTDDEACMVREIVQRQDALNDPYAWHKGIEEFLRGRARSSLPAPEPAPPDNEATGEVKCHLGPGETEMTNEINKQLVAALASVLCIEAQHTMQGLGTHPCAGCAERAQRYADILGVGLRGSDHLADSGVARAGSGDAGETAPAPEPSGRIWAEVVHFLAEVGDGANRHSAKATRLYGLVRHAAPLE